MKFRSLPAMIAVCGTIRIATRRRPLDVIQHWTQVETATRQASKILLATPSNRQTRSHGKRLPIQADLVCRPEPDETNELESLSVVARTPDNRGIGQGKRQFTRPLVPVKQAGPGDPAQAARPQPATRPSPRPAPSSRPAAACPPGAAVPAGRLAGAAGRSGAMRLPKTGKTPVNLGRIPSPRSRAGN
jgi:hypothetical protein